MVSGIGDVEIPRAVRHDPARITELGFFGKCIRGEQFSVNGGSATARITSLAVPATRVSMPGASFPALSAVTAAAQAIGAFTAAIPLGGVAAPACVE